MITELQEIFKRIEAQRKSTTVEKPAYECEKCNDTEFILYKDENGSEYAKECDCRQLKITKRLLDKSGITEEFRQKSFGNFDDRGLEILANAKNKAVEYYMNFSKIENERVNSIVLCGQVGSGKTHLGMALANNLISQKKVGVLYVEYRNLATMLKQNVTDEIKYNEALERCKRARVLFIDDLLKGKVTDADINLLYEIINFRYLNKLPLIISTEKTRTELIEFDEAIASRIIEMSKGYLVELTGKELNYRLYGN